MKPSFIAFSNRKVTDGLPSGPLMASAKAVVSCYAPEADMDPPHLLPRIADTLAACVGE